MAQNQKQLPGSWVLCKEAWKIYRKRFWTLILIYSVSSLFSFFASLAYKQSWYWILSVLYFPVSAWTGISLIFGIGEPIDATAAFRKGVSKFIPNFLTQILFLSTLLGGMVFLLIPAIVLAVWTNFYSFIVAFENTNGLSALFLSKAYVSKYFRATFERYMFLAFPLLLFLVLTVITERMPILIRLAFAELPAILLLAFVSVYQYTLYSQLKKIKGDIKPNPGTFDKIVFTVLAIIGGVLFAFGLYLRIFGRLAL